MTNLPSQHYMIQAVDLHKSFGANHAVDGLSLTVPAGEIYGLVGADGAGKTTTIRLLVGAMLPNSGKISICNSDMRDSPDRARANIGYLSQRFSLYEDLTVLENIRFFSEVRGLSQKEWQPRCMEILEFVDLAQFKDRRAGQLSGGMRQKLALASALVTRPKVLLLDEPTTGVDPVTRQDFWQLLIRLVNGESSGDIAVLISTPYMDEAARCNRVGFMNKGRIIAEGTPKDLRARLKDRILEISGEQRPLMKKIILQDPQVEDVRAFGDRLHIRLKEGAFDAVEARLRQSIPASGAQMTSLRLIPAVLEDVFIHLSDQE